jgi:hypothetical protein
MAKGPAAHNPFGIEIGDQLMRIKSDLTQHRVLRAFFVVTDIWHDPTRAEHRRRYDRKYGWMMAVLRISICGTPYGRKIPIVMHGHASQGWQPSTIDAIDMGFRLQAEVDTDRIVPIFGTRRTRPRIEPGRPL